jgi:sugar phosphate isomerase/epimerase
MRIGVFSVPFKHLPTDQAFAAIAATGVEMVEIGCGGYPGADHCPLDELLASEGARRDYLDGVAAAGLTISALSCQWDPLSPDAEIAAHSDSLFRKTVRLAAGLGVPVVNVLSGLPAGAPGERCPTWITCPWPPHFQQMLEYQWNDVGIPYWTGAARFAADHGVRIGVEMHPGMLVYNVESLLRLRAAAGPALGCNFDPSHLFWNGVDPVRAIRTLGEAIFHMHGKDCGVDLLNQSVNGCNDPKPYALVTQRAWSFRTIGYGHDLKVWKDMVSALRLVGYDYVISVEHEDPVMSVQEGLRKGIGTLHEAIIVEPAGELFWV